MKGSDMSNSKTPPDSPPATCGEQLELFLEPLKMMQETVEASAARVPSLEKRGVGVSYKINEPQNSDSGA
jgi:hypothetical protein